MYLCICLSVFSNKPGIKSENSDVILHVALESKIKLANCKLWPKFLLGNSSLLDISATDAYIFWSWLFSPFLHSFCNALLPLSLRCTYFGRFSLYLGGLEHFAIRWSSYTHLQHLRGVRSVSLLYESTAARAFISIMWSFLHIFLLNYWQLHKKCTLSGKYLLSTYFYHNLNCCQNLDSQSVRMK